MSSVDLGNILPVLITVVGGGALAIWGKRGDNKVAEAVAALNERAANRATEVEEKRVDGESYDRAERINAASITRLEGDVAALIATVSTQKQQISGLQSSLTSQRAEHTAQLAEKDRHIARIEARADNLQRQVTTMRRTLTAAGIPPDDEDEHQQTG